MIDRKMVILTDGGSILENGKTAICLLRYCKNEVTAILDSSQKGKTAAQVTGIGGDIPFINNLEEAAPDSNTLIFGLALIGGKMLPHWLPFVKQALEKGWTVVTSTHDFLTDNEDLLALAEKFGGAIHDTRKPPAGIKCNDLSAHRSQVRRVLTVGTDCDSGKMSTAMELCRSLVALGIDAGFGATGQTGMMISGSGIAIDAVPADFIAGAAEAIVQENDHRQVVVLEGQGCINHPLYSGVSLGLLHGSAPEALILCHSPTRVKMRGLDWPICSVPESIAWHENVGAMVRKTKVIGIALHGGGLTSAEINMEINRLQDETGLPVTDVYVRGADILAREICDYFQLNLVPQ